MATLYELTGEFLEIYDLDIDDETKQDTIESLDLEKDLEEKAEGYAMVIKNLQADEKMYADAEREFKLKKQAAKKKYEGLKARLVDAMIATHHERFDGQFKISLRKSTRVDIFDESKIPEKYIKTEVVNKPMKADIKKAIQNGETVFGAELKEGKSLQIR